MDIHNLSYFFFFQCVQLVRRDAERAIILSDKTPQLAYWRARR
jgi:hypothetical protein